MLRWKTTMKEKKAKMEHGTTEGKRHPRNFTVLEIRRGWNMSAAGLHIFSDSTDDDKLVPAERTTNRERLNSLEEALKIIDKCSALGDHDSCLPFRRAADEPTRTVSEGDTACLRTHDLLSKIVVPFVAPRITADDRMIDTRSKVAGRTAAWTPRLDNRALWLADSADNPSWPAPFSASPGRPITRPAASISDRERLRPRIEARSRVGGGGGR
ncbi:hypothetical protein PG994_003034 [Apiospora phragmitis]|uniref:Uncharacterized protein n=1 Tax=Apiospora phragmitis TaxID=2905665 RepID=A0ABR1W752_9PEZI